MFFSQLLLSSKGALGTIWVAAHCYKKLKKEQVQKTNISSSVDKILYDEVAVFAQRILAFLLLGVVRIYSKKVDYLLHDSQDMLNRLTEFKNDKKKRKSIGSSQSVHVGPTLPTRPKRTRHGITLPKRFELDAFDLELTEDREIEGRNVRSREEIMLLGDGREKEGSTSGLLYKESVSSSGAHSTDYTPPRDVLSFQQMEQDHSTNPTNKTNTSVPSLETFRGTSFTLEDRLEPMVLDESEEKQMNDKPSDKNPVNFQEPIHDMNHDISASPLHNKRYHYRSSDILNGTGFALEDPLEPMVLDKSAKEQLNDKPSNENPNHDHLSSLEMLNGTGLGLESRLGSMVLEETEKEQMNERSFDYNDNVVEEEHLERRSSLQENELGNKEEHVGSKKIKFSENLIPEIGNFQRSEANPVSITVDVTPETKVADFSTVPTPAPMESAKIVKKRNTTFDETTMIPGDVYKEWLSNPSDLIRKRKVVPHTRLHAWKVDKLRRMPHSLTEPYITGMSTDLRSLEVEKNTLEPPEVYEVGSPVMEEDREQTQVVGSLVMKEGGEQTQAVGSPVDEDGEETLDVRSSPISKEQAPIAPGTPVTGSFEIGGVAADSDVLEPTNSFESIEKPSDGMDLDAVLLNETNSSEGDSLEKDTFSARTRVVGSYLHKNFLDKKSQKKDEVLNLSDLTKGKTKKESARLFLETLVLKSRDCIDVKQKKPYGDILLRETPKLKSLNLDKEE